MKYKFPQINHIDEVRNAIRNRDEFIEADRGDFIVFNYLVNYPDTFEDPGVDGISEGESRCRAIRRECRGLTFDKQTGKVVARKFQKFFNLNEKKETEFRNVDFSRPHVILEKLDGSMVTPYAPRDEDGLVDCDDVVWHTKMGATDVAEHVNRFVKKHPEYARWCAMVMSNNMTPIFEFCSRLQRIVIDYPEDRLVLLAIRNNNTGDYLHYDELLKAETHGIEVVRQYAGNAANMESLVEETRELSGAEGWVIRFEDGHMIKVKSTEYVTLHKAISSLSQEKDIWNLVLSDSTDDLKSFLPEDQRNRLDEFHSELWHRINELVIQMEQFVDQAVNELNARDWSVFADANRERKKAFVIEYVNAGDFDSRLNTVLFKAFEGASVRNELVTMLKNNTSTRTKVDRVRSLLGELRWDEIIIEE